DQNGVEIKPGSRVVYTFGSAPFARGIVQMINQTEGWAQIKITEVKGIGTCIDARFDTLKVT
ncbi:hypothetical protein LCGC14_2739150, partial [marine sediment metagenome]